VINRRRVINASLGRPVNLRNLRHRPSSGRSSYTSETWARLAQKPEDRRNAARTYIEAVGGKLNGFWYAFGEYDAYNLWEAPDNVSMAAVSMAISGGGALSKYETTVLLTVEETMDAMRRASEIRYRPPGT
jgi:uncharacterized protein with GYD domain